MNKREKAKAARVTAEKAALRAHLILLLLGANGRPIDSTVMDDGCDVAGLGVDVFGRWLGAIKTLHQIPEGQSAAGDGWVGRWSFEPVNMDDWATIDKAVDKLHANGVTADFRAQFEPVPLPEPAPADGWAAVGPKLLHALHHMHYCAGCGEGPWEDCEGGRAAWEAMAEAGALLPAPPSAQPPADSAWQPAEPSARERRLAEALRDCVLALHSETGKAFGEVAPEHAATVDESLRVLASPEAPAACWCRAGAQEPCEGFVFGRGDECRACGRCEKCHGVCR